MTNGKKLAQEWDNLVIQEHPKQATKKVKN